MLPFYLDLLWRAFKSLPSSLGSNPLGLLWPLLLTVVALIAGALRKGWRTVIKTQIKKYSLNGLAALGVCYLCLFIWCLLKTNFDDHQALTKKIATYQVNPPPFNLEIMGYADGTRRPVGLYQIEVTVLISNPNGPPRSFSDWRIELSSGGKTLLGHPAVLQANGERFHMQNKDYTAPNENYCPRAMQEIVPQGGSRQCWMLCVFDAPAKDLLSQTGRSFTLKVKDVVTEKDYSFIQPIKQELDKLY